MHDPTLVVLAAGIGSRYGGLKQMEPMGPHGELIIDYSVYDALRAGFGRVVFVIRADMEQSFRERVGLPIERRCDVAYAFQRLEDLPRGFDVPPGRQKPWGTTHAVLCCRGLVDGPFGVINADDFYGRSSYAALCRFLQDRQGAGHSTDYAMVGYLLGNTLSEHGHVSRGVCAVDRDGFLVDIRERLRIEQAGDGARFTEDGESWQELAPGTVVSMNMWGFTPPSFDQLEACFRAFLQGKHDNLLKAELLLPNVVGDLLRSAAATVKVLPTDEQWFGVTYQQDRPVVKEAIRRLVDRGIYPESLWGGQSS